MHGVNLGNWLIVEKWMCEELFAGTGVYDEYGLSQTAIGKERIKRHRDTYITEADFMWMAKNNIELLRIPVGYWLFEEDESYVSGVRYLDWAMEMAQKYNLKVLIDLHGAPGSQNGLDHGGKIGDASWYKDKIAQAKTIQILNQIATRYYDNAAFWGLEILNEPKFGWDEYWILRRFYKRTYKSLKKTLRPGIYTIFSDAYRPLLFTGMLYGSRKFPVAMDIHWYAFAVNWRRLKTIERYFKKVSRRKLMLKLIQLFHPVIIGEWNASLPEEALQGKSQAERNAVMREHYSMQKSVYAEAKAEFYWNYLSSRPSVWNYRDKIGKF